MPEHIGLQVQPAPSGSQLFVIDPEDRPPVPAVVGAVAGYLYRLPPLARLAPVVRIRVLSKTRFNAELYNRANYIAPVTYDRWFITTKDPTGKDLLTNAPLSQFLDEWPGVGSPQRNAHLRTLADHWIDPLQSYVFCIADNTQEAPVIVFDYA